MQEIPADCAIVGQMFHVQALSDLPEPQMGCVVAFGPARFHRRHHRGIVLMGRRNVGSRNGWMPFDLFDRCELLAMPGDRTGGVTGDGIVVA